MLNYDELVTQAHDHRTWLLTNAQQQRFAQAVAPAQPHPLITWIGQQLIEWGQQLQGEPQQAMLPVSPFTTR